MSDYEFVSPIEEGHIHYAEANKVGCAVCELEAERDRLRAVVEAARACYEAFDDDQCLDPDHYHEALGEALAQLDASGVMGGSDGERS